MNNNRWLKYLPTREQVQRYRVLRPLARRLQDRALWSMNRRSVARGVAVGLFFGILIPVAQIFFAVLAAMALRANIPAAAGSTLITNPFTFPFVYYLAYRLGSVVRPGGGDAQADLEFTQEMARSVMEVHGWVPRLQDLALSIGLPLAVGLATLAVAAALIGYLAVEAIWRWRDARRSRPRG
jgi:uncharacterized protein (DUF2062 family)